MIALSNDGMINAIEKGNMQKMSPRSRYIQLVLLFLRSSRHLFGITEIATEVFLYIDARFQI